MWKNTYIAMKIHVSDWIKTEKGVCMRKNRFGVWLGIGVAIAAIGLFVAGCASSAGAAQVRIVDVFWDTSLVQQEWGYI
ncbi:MAG: hypothetical protein LBI14_10090 [Treponema sp.]|jgi:hypothetical protein|nr:hypothetical protein [Treponema sp.]